MYGGSPCHGQFFHLVAYVWAVEDFDLRQFCVVSDLYATLQETHGLHSYSHPITLLILISLFLWSWVSTLRSKVCDWLQLGIRWRSMVPVLAMDSFFHIVGYVRAPENVDLRQYFGVRVGLMLMLRLGCDDIVIDWLYTYRSHRLHCCFLCYRLCGAKFVTDVVGFVWTPEMSNFLSGLYWHETVRDLYAKWFLFFCTWVEVEVAMIML